jgi:hypothetical protein
MKFTISVLLAAIAILVLCSFAQNKPDKIERRKGVINVNENGKVIFTPLEDWQEFTPKNDTVYQYKVG